MKQINFTLGWILAIALAAATLQAAGGSKTPSSTAPATENPTATAEDSYNRALHFRDQAWKLEARAGEDPEAAEKLLKKAASKYKKMENTLRVALKADPRMYQAHSSLGYVLRKTGQFDQSINAYNQALTLNPLYTEAIEYRAEAYLGLGRLDEVKAAYMELFRSDREKADQLIKAAQTWLSQQDKPGAEVVEFGAWVKKRAQVANQTASLLVDSSDNW